MLKNTKPLITVSLYSALNPVVAGDKCYTNYYNCTDKTHGTYNEPTVNYTSYIAYTALTYLKHATH